MAVKEVDLLGDAIAGTEAEIFGEAIDGIEVEAGEDKPDRSLEAMDEVEETEDAGEGEGEEGEGEGEESEAKPARDDKGKFAAKDDEPGKGEKSETGDEKGLQVERKGDPSVPLREERQRRQGLETELEKERRERATERDGFKSEFAKLEGRLDQLQRTQPQPQKTEEPKATTKPDIFTDPEGYDRWVEDQIAQRTAAVERTFTDRLINASFADAHEKHSEKFDTAYTALRSLDPQNPAHRSIVHNIRTAPNPGAALMRWHGQQETLREVGHDPAAYRQRIAEETRAQLLKDPEFRKQLIEEMRADAGGTNGGRPRTIIRKLPSLNGAAGRGDSQVDPRAFDNSEGSVFESAFES